MSIFALISGLVSGAGAGGGAGAAGGAAAGGAGGGAGGGIFSQIMGGLQGGSNAFDMSNLDEFVKSMEDFNAEYSNQHQRQVEDMLGMDFGAPQKAPRIGAALDLGETEKPSISKTTGLSKIAKKLSRGEELSYDDFISGVD